MGVSLKRKNHHWFNLGPDYQLAEFELRVLVGAANLRLELWSSSANEVGVLLSGKHDDIAASWTPPRERERGPTGTDDSGRRIFSARS